MRPARVPAAFVLGPDLFVNPDVTLFLVGSGHRAQVQVGIPAVTQLVGTELFQQGVLFDGLANGLGIVMSDAVRAVVGI